MLITPLKSNKQIVIANKINEARYKMSRAEQKLFLYCVGMIDNRVDNFDEVLEITIIDFAKYLELDSSNLYRSILPITRDFMSRVLEFHDENLGRLRQINILSYIDYDPKIGRVFIKVNPDFKPYLIDLKSHFTQFSLQETIQYKSMYSMRIYQILCQWGYKEKVEYPIERLRFMLNIEPHEFERYNDFKRFVLEKAYKEINKSSTLKFAYKEVKTGRKITHIVFIIKQAVKPDKSLIPKPFEIPKQEESKEVKFRTKEEIKTEIPEKYTPNFVISENQKKEISFKEFYNEIETVKQGNSLSDEYINLEKKLLELSFNSQRAGELIKDYGIEYLKFVLEKSKIETRDKVDNKAGYLLTLINTYKQSFEDCKEEKRKKIEQERMSQIHKEEYEKIQKEQEEKFEREQEELSRDILETEPEIFCKAVYKYLQTFVVDLKNFGFTYHPEWHTNREKNHEENLRIARDIRSQFMACSDLRDFRNLIKYDEDWLFKAVFNNPKQFDKDESEYYRKSYNIPKIELPFKI